MKKLLFIVIIGLAWCNNVFAFNWISTSVDIKNFEAAWAARFPKTALSRIGQMGPSKSGAPYIDASTGKDITWTKGFEHFS